jgi:hypothetical protein
MPTTRRTFIKGAAAVGAGGAVVARRPRSRSIAQAAQAAGPSPDAPLFRDPIFDGASDPTVIYNADTSEWWMFYTARRANVSTPGVGWVHGSDIGIATSTNGGRSWLYRGTAEGLAFEPGRNTYWAPEVIEDRGTFHMYVSFVRGVPSVFSGERHILHYRSKDLWNWRLVARLDLSSDRVIDACVWPLPDGSTWRMWFKDEADGSHIYAADSHDLSAWKVMGRAFASGGQEGPNVFRFAGSYWMITAPNRGGGMPVYRSDDLQTWTQQPNLILSAPGHRPEDGTFGNHGVLLAQGDSAFIAYFTQFGQVSRIQAAPLAVVDGQLAADRDTPFAMDWKPELTVALRGGELSA